MADFVVYDQYSIVAGSPSGELSIHRTAEQFVLSNPTKVSGFTVALIETGTFQGNGVLEGFGGLAWAVYSGTSHPSGSPLASGSVSPSGGLLTDSGFDTNNFDVFEFHFNIPQLSLGAGDYWLALVENAWGQANDGTSIQWYETTAGLDETYRHGLFQTDLPNPATSSSFSSDQGRHAALLVHAVPEPAATSIAASVLLMGFVLTRRRKSKPRIVFSR